MGEEGAGAGRMDTDVCVCVGGGGGGGRGGRREKGDRRKGKGNSPDSVVLPEFDHIFVKQRFVWDQRKKGMSSSQITAI